MDVETKKKEENTNYKLVSAGEVAEENKGQSEGGESEDIGNRPGRNEGITAVDGNHLARKGRRCGDACEHDRDPSSMPNGSERLAIWRLSPYGRPPGPGSLTSARNRFQ